MYERALAGMCQAAPPLLCAQVAPQSSDTFAIGEMVGVPCTRPAISRSAETGVPSALFVALKRQNDLETPDKMTLVGHTTPGMPHPIGPSASASFRSDLCVVALSRCCTSWLYILVIQGSSVTQPAKKGLGQPGPSKIAADRTQCGLVSAFVACSSAVCHCNCFPCR